MARGTSPGAIPVFERSIVLNPEAGYSYLQLGLLLSWEKRYAEAERVLRRAVDLQDQFISGNAGLQMVGANARLGYVFYLQGRNDDAIREYERGMAFLQTSDHALKERSVMELDIKLGAAYLRRRQDGRRPDTHFDRALKTFESRVAKGADDPFTRYYVADLHALRGDADRAFDSLERVFAKQPALTAARIVRDPDLASLTNDPRFARIADGRGALSEIADRSPPPMLRCRHRRRRPGGAECGAGARAVPPVGAGLRHRPAAQLRLARDARLPDARRHAAVRVPRTVARRELAQYDTVSCASVEVTGAECQPGGQFEVTLATGEELESRKLLVATGVADNAPGHPRLRSELYGRSVFHCPYCDGWEVRDTPLAIYGRGRARVRAVARADRLEPRPRALHRRPERARRRAALATLERNGISVREDRVARLEGDDGVLRHVVFASGERLARRALFFSTGQSQQSTSPIRLGCEINDKGTVRTGRYEATHLPGLYVAGDASRAVQWVVVAAAEGAEAAFAINTALIKSDLAGLVFAEGALPLGLS